MSAAPSKNKLHLSRALRPFVCLNDLHLPHSCLAPTHTAPTSSPRAAPPPSRLLCLTADGDPVPDRLRLPGRGRRHWIVSPHLLGRSGPLSLVDESRPHPRSLYRIVYLCLVPVRASPVPSVVRGSFVVKLSNSIVLGSPTPSTDSSSSSGRRGLPCRHS